MKKISLLLSTLIVLLSLNVNASNDSFNFEEEAYINDITINTENLYADYSYQMAITIDYDFEEEKYIQDIPFDTECVTVQCRYLKAIGIEFEMEEEASIDDIPFEKVSTL